MKGRIIGHVMNFFDQQQDDFNKPGIVGNFWSRNCIEYESYGERNKALLIEKYLNKIRLYLKMP